MLHRKRAVGKALCSVRPCRRHVHRDGHLGGTCVRTVHDTFGQRDVLQRCGWVTFTYADTSEPSSLNPMVGFLGTDYTMWAMTYDLPIDFSTADFSADLDIRW